MDTEAAETLRDIGVTIAVAVKAGREYVVLQTEDAKWLLERAKELQRQKEELLS
jgi:hypothetical protein